MKYDKPTIQVWRFSPRVLQSSSEKPDEPETEKVDVTFGTTIDNAWDRQEEIEL